MERLGFRSFLFEADGTMRRLSQRLSRDLATDARTTLPEYAGQSLRHAFVVLELDERGRPARIERIEGTVFDFDERGSVQASLARGAMKALEIGDALKKRGPEAASGPVVDMKLHFASKQREARHHWTPGPEEIEQIVKAIWKPRTKRPGAGPGGSRTRKRPSLTVVS